MRIAIMILATSVLASSCANTTLNSRDGRHECDAPQSREEAARQAFFFAFPVYEMSRMRQRMLAAPDAEINSLRHRMTLSGPDDRYITTPNNDTLYSAAWLDLSTGPVRLSIPAMGARYHSVELMDMFSDAFAILRNKEAAARSFLIVGPDWSGQAAPGETTVRSPTRDAWLVIRTHVQETNDLAEAQRLQTTYALESTGSPAVDTDFETIVPDKPDGFQFLSVVNKTLARGPTPKIHDQRLTCFSAAGIAPEKFSSAPELEPAMQQTWDLNISIFYTEAKLAFETSGLFRNGWQYPQPNIAVFGIDDVYRSALALGGLAALPVEEAINPMTSVDSEGRVLSGRSLYKLRIPGDVPVDGFWSLTLYESDGAGRWFLYDNVLDRYAISSTTHGLKREPDGAIVLQISHQEPTERTNWMPAPRGDYRLVFRAYQPRPEFLNGSFKLPPVQRLPG